MKTPRKSPARRADRPAPAPRPWPVAGICALLVALVFIVFGQTLRFGFVNYDDNTNVYETPQVVAGISPRGIAWAFTHTQVGRWTPAATLSRMLDCQLYGLWPGGHHLTNLLLHALASVLLFLLLLQLTGAIAPSAFVAAVFAVHPLHVESVAWVSARGEVLSGLFFMLALWSYALYARPPARRAHYALSLLWFLLGLLAKPMIVTLPCLLLLLDYWPLRRFGKVPLSRLLAEKIPFLLISIASGAVTFWVTPDTHAADHLPLWLRLDNALVSYPIYLRQTLWPAGLAVYYPNPRQGFPLWEVAASLGLLCLISVASVALRKRHPSLLTGWLWFTGMLIPVIGIVQVSNYAHADRYTYLPQIGLCIAAAWGVADLTRQWRHRRVLLGGAAALVLCGLAIAAWRQTASWRDGKTLWTHALASTRDNDIAHNNLGNLLIDEGRPAEATAQYAEAVRINPAYVDARNNLAHMLFQAGRPADALAQYQAALRIDPGYAPLHNTYGMDLFRMGRVDEAAAQFRDALRIDPDFADAHTCLGNIFLSQGRAADAIAQYREVLRINPADPTATGNLCAIFIALFQHGQAAEALTAARQTLAIQPASPAIRNTLAWMLATAPATPPTPPR